MGTVSRTTGANYWRENAFTASRFRLLLFFYNCRLPRHTPRLKCGIPALPFHHVVGVREIVQQHSYGGHEIEQTLRPSAPAIAVQVRVIGVMRVTLELEKRAVDR